MDNDGYVNVSAKWLAENYSRAQRITAGDASRVTVNDIPDADDADAQVGDTDDGLKDLADRLGKPAASLSGRALAMARTKNGGVNPAGSQPEIDASKLTGRALHMHQIKQGGSR